jgi:Fe-S-cluster-containing dehydrogenase component
MNNYEKYTSSPEMLEKLLKEVSTREEKPWEIAFNRIFCHECEHDTCPEVCPHEEQRDNPGWWLGLEAEHGDV